MMIYHFYNEELVKAWGLAELGIVDSIFTLEGEIVIIIAPTMASSRITEVSISHIL